MDRTLVDSIRESNDIVHRIRHTGLLPIGLRHLYDYIGNKTSPGLKQEKRIELSQLFV